MGLFDRLFKKDPEEELRKAEEHLAAGRPVDALHLADPLRDSAPGPLRARAETVAQRAHDQILQAALKRSQEAEEAGRWAEAAEWVRTAIEHAADEQQADKLEALAEALDERRHAGDEEEDEPAFGAEAEEVDEELAEDLYWSQIAMLEEDVAERYEGRSESFRRALVDLGAGHAERAEAALSRLLERDGEDAVLRFERGRARLMLDRLEPAREDFELAWSELGDAPLDLGGVVSVPGLWAETMLALERPEPVLDRLEELADPQGGRGDLVLLYGKALLAAGRPQQAAEHLAQAFRTPLAAHPEIPLHLALALERSGEPAGAIRVLESAIAPSCATGACAKPPKHLPSFRLLTRLYLDDGGEPELERAGELLEQVDRAGRGRSTAEDQLLAARYYELHGDEAAAAEARRRAEELAATADEVSDAGDQPSLQVTQRRPL